MDLCLFPNKEQIKWFWIKYGFQGGKMRHIKVYYLIIIFTLLVTGCAGIDKEKSPSNTKITIEPYNLTLAKQMWDELNFLN